MANEATVFSLTTAEMATAVASQVGDDVDIATANAAAVPASIDIGLYFLKTKYESTDHGRSRLLQHIDQIKARIVKAAWPAI